MDALELAISPDGTPANPVLVVALDAWAGEPHDRIERAARSLAGSLRLTIGTLRHPAPPSLAPLLRAVTLTLAETAHPATTIVDCPDPDAALKHLEEAVRRNPRASVALGRLLRQTTVPDTFAGLGAEASVYSMLLAGSEFRRWLAARGGPKPINFPDRPLVRLDRDGELLSVVLDHPERRNALSFRLREELLEALRLAELDPGIGRVLLRGSGPVFCSGGDLDEFGTAHDVVAAYLVRLERAPWRIIDRLRDRVSAHVQGACIGAGIEMAAFAGRLVATPETFFRLPEIEMGLVPGAGGTVSIPRRIGRWRAAWMMLTGDRIDTATALRWNLIDAVEGSAIC
ncbi:putative enoyl-CoA hydratase echA14 [Nocardia gamkensis]|uniref:Enoyl-CoA hydratase/isomerase family protein n=2 Tax=Nocardia gamkensis TaxID=352869 RepID=A0A7X6L0Y6_9NOCA|nr:enoyl-CoA hydratase/isomerase family protein [Nocardia gamkensis]NQE68969.1 putative enoyl-CoA hydratase echA14 [Nocardia gamkensis]